MRGKGGGKIISVQFQKKNYITNHTECFIKGSETVENLCGTG